MLFNIPHLQELDLSYNNISSLSYNDLKILSRHIKINLTHNSINKINFQDIEYSNFNINTEKIEIFVESNPIICNCKILEFILFLRNQIATSETNKILKIFPGNLKCSAPIELNGKLVTDVHPKELLCPLELNFSLITKCPNRCTCWIRPYDKTLFINCSNAELIKVPILPHPEIFKLKSISLNIENNHLIRLPHADISGYSDIKEIYARHNNINEISMDNIPKKLEILDLAYNNLTWMNNSILQNFNHTNKLKLSLGNNPWICSCDNFEFLSFIRNNFKIIQDLNTINCITKENQLLSILLSKNLCSKKEIIITTCLLIIGLGFIIGIFIALFYKYRKQICIKNRNIKRWFKNKKYDALLIYSRKDENFIIENLISNLENESNSLKLCFYNKDWIIGDFSSSEFINTVNESESIILVLTENFIKFIWNRIEFKETYISIINKKQINVIIIICDDISNIDELDIELKTYIKMNTYIKWNDSWFWNKLKNLLPTKTHLNQVRNLTDDKLKLITSDQLISSSSKNVAS